MKTQETRHPILLDELRGINLETTLFGGQSFRWRRCDDGSAVGTICARPVRVRVEQRGLVVTALAGKKRGFEQMVRRYFDAVRDYGEIERGLLADPRLRATVAAYSGIRILRQPPFETLVSFVVSANNNIPRIRRALEALARMAGVEVGGELWAFPMPEALAAIGPARLRAEANLGYRDRYVHELSRIVAAGGVDLDAFDALATPHLREALVRLPGVGPKVADCVALFAYGRLEVFPVDTWVRRAVAETFLAPGARHSDREIREFARRRFGPVAGVAQQYLFEAFRSRR